MSEEIFKSIAAGIYLFATCILVVFAKDQGYKDGRRDAEKRRIDNFLNNNKP